MFSECILIDMSEKEKTLFLLGVLSHLLSLENKNISKLKRLMILAAQRHLHGNTVTKQTIVWSYLTNVQQEV